MAFMDIIVRAKDDASKVLRSIGDSGSNVGKTLADNWGKISLAMGSAGIALEALGRQQAELTVGTQNLAAATGIQADKMRDIIGSTANVGFSIDDVISVMKIGREEGLKSATSLKKYADYWDMVAKASGESSADLAQSSVALNAVGIEAGQEGEATKAFGFVLRETTLTVKSFMDFIGKSGVKLKTMGLDINDTAALLKALSDHFGISGRQAKLILGKGIDDADGSFTKLLSNLGLSKDEFDKWRTKVDESGNVLKEQAKNQEKSYTMMQHLNEWVKRLTYSYGDLITSAASFSTILVAVGPAIGGVKIGFNIIKTLVDKFRTLTGTVKACGSATELWSAMNQGKVLPALVRVTSKVGTFISGLATAPLNMFTDYMAAMGTSAVLTAVEIAGVTLAIAALVFACYEAVKAYQELAKAWGQEKEAETQEMEMLRQTYEKQGSKAAEAQLAKHKDTMTAGTYAQLRNFLTNLETAAQPGTELYKPTSSQDVIDIAFGGKPMAAGGLVTKPTLALIGESGPEAVVPLRGGNVGGTMNHTGTITVRGVDSAGMLKAVIPIVIDQLRREIRFA